MKVGIIVPCFNRIEYLRDCLWSLDRVELPENCEILFIDDCSTDKQTQLLLEDWDLNKPNLNVTVIWSQKNEGIKKSLLFGYDYFFNEHNFDLVINFDSDAIIRPDAITKLIQNYIPGTLLTGFHSTNKNRDGSERHKILSETENLYFKHSVGGINFCVDKEAYLNYLFPVLNEPVGNFDHHACLKAGGAYCLKESVIEHIGFNSSLNHFENPDVAHSFHYWNLPNVTLIGVDSNKERLQVAADKCTKYIKFGEVVLLNPNITSKEEYSRYCIHELYKHVKTDYLLICQYDGFVNNWKAWENEFLNYDYIGAPWHYTDGMAVGNGGFSLRSRKLMEILAHDNYIIHNHPEDHHICRTYRSYLEAKYGIKFAPVEVAERFAFEGYLQPNKVLKDQFGVHGLTPRTQPQPPIRGERYVFNQFLSLGDILFLIPMARALMAEGNSVMWPIDKRYLDIKKHFPDIAFVCKDDYVLPYEMQAMVNTPYGKLIPYRFASEIMRRGLKDAMRSKYELYKHDHRMWRQLYWSRDRESELNLMNRYGIEKLKPYQVVNKYYGHKAELTVDVKPNPNLPIIEMEPIPGFTLIDWLGIIENASEIHMANSSLNYLIELMDLDIPVHLYKRDIWGENLFEYSDYLFENKCFIFHRD